MIKVLCDLVASLAVSPKHTNKQIHTRMRIMWNLRERVTVMHSERVTLTEHVFCVLEFCDGPTLHFQACGRSRVFEVLSGG
jgi:hypothetical protein